MQRSRHSPGSDVSMKTVIVVSPFHETVERSRRYHTTFAKLLCHRAAKAGVTPFASHLFYPQFLNEDDPADRELGLACEHGWIDKCDELWIWNAWGISPGMQAAIDYVLDHDLPVEMKLYTSGLIPEWNGLDQWESERKVG